MADTLERIYKLTVDGSQAINQLDKIAKSTASVDSRMASMGGAIKGAFAGLIAGGTLAAVGAAFKKATDGMEEMATAAQKVGTTTESLSRLKYAAEQSNVSFDSLQQGMKKLTKGMADVETGTDGASKALRALGVRSGDSPEQALNKIADAFASVPDSAQKTALALEIFGKSGADMIPLLNEGSAAIEELTTRAERLGVVIDGETAKQADAFNDSLADMSTVLGSITKTITAGAMPAMSNLATTLAESLAVSKEWKEIGRGLGDVILWIADKSVKATATIFAFGKGIGALAAAGAALASGEFSQAKNILSEWVNDVDKIGADTEEVSKRLAGMNASMTATGETAKGSTNGVRSFNSAVAGLKTETDKASKSARELKEEMTPLQKLFYDFAKPVESRNTALSQLDALADPNNLATLQAMGVTLDEIIAKFDELMNTAGIGDPLAGFVKSVKDSQYELDLMPQKIRVLQEMLAQGVISQETFDKFNDSLKKTSDNLDEIGVAVGTSLQQGVAGLVDVFFEADQSFSQFAANFLKSIAKMIAQLLILKAIKTAFAGTAVGDFFGFAKGGAFNGATGLQQGVYTQPTFFNMPGEGLAKYANGGVVGRGMGVLAEAGRPEAIVPLVRHGADLGVKSSPVNVSVYNQANATVEVTETQNQDGSKSIDILVKRKVKEMFGAGEMDRTMRTMYGVSRVPA